MIVKSTTVKILLILMIVLGSLSGRSQIVIGLLFGDKLNQGPIEFGFNLSGNYNMVNAYDGSDANNGLAFGLYIDYNFSEKWILSGSFLFKSGKGATQLDQKYLFTHLDTFQLKNGFDRNMSYFDLPLMMEFRPLKHFGFGLGFYGAYLVKAHDYYEIDIDPVTASFNSNVTEHFNRFDFGLIGGVHYHFKKDPGAQIRLNYCLGLVAFQDETSARNQTFQIGVMIPVKFGADSD